MTQFESDILQRLEEDFPEERTERALELLTHLHAIPESTRNAQCCLYLARGSLKRLKKAVQLAQQDCRDVIWRAEYDGGETRLRNFAAPLGAS